MTNAIGSVISAIFSRWTALLIITLLLMWNINTRVDHLGSANLQTTAVTVSDSAAAP